MSSNKESTLESEKLDSLLADDAKAYPVQESPWFATRTVAMAKEIPQQRGWLIDFFTLPRLRWLPIPLAGLAGIAFFLIQHSPAPSPAGTFSSSESEFEQHMELFVANDYTQ